jgi:hypothetical protein
MKPKGAISTLEEVESIRNETKTVYLVFNYHTEEPLMKVTLTQGSIISQHPEFGIGLTNVVMHFADGDRKPRECFFVRPGVSAFAFTNYWLAYAQMLRVLKKQKEG